MPFASRSASDDGPGLVVDDTVVDARTAAADQPPRFAVGSGEAGEAEQLEGRHAAGQQVARHRGLRQFAAAAAALEDGARGLGGRLGRFPAVTQRRRLGCQDLLRLVDVAALQPLDLGEVELGEEAQKAADIGVLGIAPELPVFVGRQPLGIEPNGALRASCPSWRRRRS